MSERDIQKFEKTDLSPTEGKSVWIPPGYELAPDQPPEEPGSHLWDYVGLIWRRRWLVLLVFLCSAAVAGFLAHNARPVYEAVAKLEIKQPEGMKILSSKFEPIEQGQESNYIETQLHIIRSRDLARRVVERLDLFAPKESDQPVAEKPKSRVGDLPAYLKSFGGHRKSAEAPDKNETSEKPADPLAAKTRSRVNAFLGCLDVKQVRGTQIVEINFVHEDPELCVQMANALCEEYISWIYQSKSDSYKKALESIQEELKVAKTKLGESEKVLQEFAKKNEISLPVGDQGEYSRQLGETKRQLEEAERVVFEKKLRLQRFDAGTSLAALLSDNPRVQKLLDAIGETNTQLARAREQFGPQMTEIRSVESARRELESELRAEYLRTKEKAQLEHREAQAAYEFLQKKYKEQSGALVKMEAIDSYNTLKEEVDLNRQIHTSLRQRERELIVTSRVQVGNVAVIEAAEPRPQFPNKVRTLALGALIGLFLGILLVLFLDYMDTTVKGPEEIERIAQLPTLAYIPRFKNGWRWARSNGQVFMITHKQPESPIAESFRYLRTSVLYSLASRSPKTILVTSAIEGEGKTTVATNLAIAFAQKGKEVILLDADLSRPALHKCFHVERSKGLTEILTGKLDEEIGCDARDPFRKTDVSNLFLLPCGMRVPNPVDLLDSESMRDLIVLLAEEYEHVIIDSAPLMIGADTNVLVPYVDGVVLVVQPGRTPRNAVRRAKEKVSGMQGRILGVVLNNPKQDPGWSSGYGYGYGYSYGYGRHNTEGDQTNKDRAGLAQAANPGTALPPPDRSKV
jgi:capsular exopolysaccharide synthesis family protein